MKTVIKLKCGYELLSLSEEEAKYENEDYNRTPIGLLKLEPGGFVYTETIARFADQYFDFKFNNDDVLLMGIAKSGTTWCQEILWTLMHNANLDNPKALLHINRRVPFFEHDCALTQSHVPPLKPGNIFYDTFVKDFPDKDPNNGIVLQTLESMRSPRITKTHFLFSYFKPKILDCCKIVYIARHPKDVIYSTFHYFRLVKSMSYVGTLDKFLDKFIANGVKGPRASLYWTHVKEAWERRNHPNLHIIFYEDLKANPKAEYTRLQHFLGLNLTEKQLENIVQYTSFAAMKDRDSKISDKFNSSENNPDIEKEGGFFRKGVSGESNKYTKDQERKLDEWIKENARELGPEFRYSK